MINKEITWEYERKPGMCPQCQYYLDVLNVNGDSEEEIRTLDCPSCDLTIVETWKLTDVEVRQGQEE